MAELLHSARHISNSKGYTSQRIGFIFPVISTLGWYLNGKKEAEKKDSECDG